MKTNFVMPSQELSYRHDTEQTETDFNCSLLPHKVMAQTDKNLRFESSKDIVKEDTKSNRHKLKSKKKK